ncbi:unnamed protein product [Thelazia callipaeda]|uniref:Uncharacterized protein n=1 Tax=Thelazia callipaeda TaxID=103827 RepID=A0A0N5CY31_THECL|nr:unnamed protein product [Thelazia callipaeda]
MQIGEIITYILGAFSIVLIIATMFYYRYCKIWKLLFTLVNCSFDFFKQSMQFKLFSI